MSDWASYSLSSFMLFSPATYYRLFELYNHAVWPLHIVSFLLGVAVIGLWFRQDIRRGRAIAVILAACWLWVAGAYLLMRYDSINWAAKFFAVGFVLQALLLIWLGAIRDRLMLSRPAGMTGWGGFAIVVFAFCIQPLAAPLLGRPWSQIELFGMTPDPTAVATLGVLAAGRPPASLFVMPTVWCALSGATLWAMHAQDALITPSAALLALSFAALKKRSTAP